MLPYSTAQPVTAGTCAAGCTRYVEPGVLEEAQQWANFAIAAYGTGSYVWQVPK